MKKNILMVIVTLICSALLLSGCELYDLNVTNAITEAFDEEEIDYHSFSEYAQNALYSARPELLEYDTKEDMNDDVKVIKGFMALVSDNEMEVNALTNAIFEDMFLTYGITIANANAGAISYAIKEYIDECADDSKTLKEGIYIGKVSANAPNRKVKYNGKISDMHLFVNKFINTEARDGYYRIEINEYGALLSVYWSTDKKVLKNDEELQSYYSWNMEEVQNGKSVIGVYPGSFSEYNQVSSRVLAKTSAATELNIDPNEFGEMAEDFSADDIINEFENEIDNNLIASFKEETIVGNNEIYTERKLTQQELEECLDYANAQAKLIHTAASAAATYFAIDNTPLSNEWYIWSNDTNGQNEFDLLEYVGENFSGYACFEINPSTYSVVQAFWCEDNIFYNVDFDSLPKDEELECNGNPLFGRYPYGSVASKNNDIVISDTKYNYFSNAQMVNSLGAADNSHQTTNMANNTYNKNIDPFNGLVIEYDNASPYLTASVNTANCDNDVKKYVTFTVPEGELRLGDTITVKAEWDNASIENENIQFSKSSQDYVVENAAYYLDDLNDVDISELDQLMNDYVEANAAASVSKNDIFDRSLTSEEWIKNYTPSYYLVDSVDKITCVKEYFLQLKSATNLSDDKIYNKYIRIYNVELTVHSSKHTTNATIPVAVFIDNLVLDSNKVLKCNSSEDLRDVFLYFKTDKTIAIIESNNIVAEKGAYNVTQIK